MRRINALFVTVLAISLVALGSMAFADPVDQQVSNLYVGVLIQENLTPAVTADLASYRKFLKSLPAGSHVAVGYIRPGSVEVLQPFTQDAAQAALAMRAPSGSRSMTPGSPFLAVKEFIKQFPENGNTHNVLVVVSDGLDYDYGVSFGGVTTNPYLKQAVRKAKERNVTIDTIFAPSVSEPFFTSNLIAVGQGSLGYLADETGGEDFYSGSIYISAQSFLAKIHDRLIS